MGCYLLKSLWSKLCFYCLPILLLFISIFASIFCALKIKFNFCFFSMPTSYCLCSSFHLLSLALSLSLFLPLSLPLSYTFSPPFSFPSEQVWHIVISCCTLWSVCCASLQLVCDNYGLVLKCEIFTYEINLHQPHPIT